MKLVMKVLSVCAFTVSCYGGNIVGYTTEVLNGKTNVVTVSIKDDKMRENVQTKQVAQAVTPRMDRPKLHMAELLSYVTVRLTCVRANGTSCGTGFFYDKAESLSYEIEHSMPDYDLYSDWVKNMLDNVGKREDYKYYLDCYMFLD